MSYPKIELKDVLKYIDNPEEVDKPFLFVNPASNLETFFKYKGYQLEILKEKLKLDLYEDQKEQICDNLLTNIEVGMKNGGWVVFNTDNSASFNICDFFSKFSFFDKEMFKPSKIHDKQYVLKHGILRPDKDVDIDGNKGYFEIKPKFKMMFLSNCKETEINEFLKINKDIEFNTMIVN